MMQHSDFVPLHVHTEYSLLDGAIKLSELVKTASEYRMPAVAMTDHGNIFGAVEFYKSATKAGVNPIIGCEVYVTPGSRHDRGAQEGSARHHLVLLARDNVGYSNLVKLVSKAHIEGFYHKPRVDHELLELHHEGLIALSACLKGEVPSAFMHGDDAKARTLAKWYLDLFGKDNYWIELQDNGLKEQNEVNPKLVALAKSLGIGLVATNDSHYMKREDARAHEILLCIQTGKTMGDPTHMRFGTDQVYFKSPDEMHAAYHHLPEAVTNTRAIAERCHVEFELGVPRLPKFAPPEPYSPSEYLEKIAREGLSNMFAPAEPPANYIERLDYELAMFKKMKFASYFLIVWDFIRHAREEGIPVGPGRGSAAGSLVANSIGITDIDPLKYGLLFERFLNPDRISMPDIDVDFCKDRRGEVIKYVGEKYGQDHVCQIITFGTMAARAAIRDVARAMDFPYADADRIAKLIPEELKMTIEKAIGAEPQLRKEYEGNDAVRDLIDVAKRLEGLSRHASTHAAGVVISREPLMDIAPLYVNQSDKSIVTQFDMKSVEAMGLIKFDFLGLKTLTIIDNTLKLLHTDGIELDMKKIPLDDKKTYDMLSAGHSTGVFQLESSGMKDILLKMAPDRFEDLIAINALYRPGPIGSGMVDDFIKRKKGLTAVRYDVPQTREVLDETYGIILYQEQVMQIANRIGDFTMGQADELRKAMGKKLADKIEEKRATFVEAAVGHGVKEAKAVKLYGLMAKFAEYGFNKSHAAAYALVIYQTAYLKANYPVHFMAASLSADLDNTEKLVKSIKECRKMGISILPPDINLCGAEFRVSGQSIRFGLGAVKGVGVAALESIIETRRGSGHFKSTEDFLRRIDSRRVNKKVIEALIKAGAMDGFCEAAAGTLGVAACRHKALKTAAEAGGGAIPSMDLFGGTPEEQAAEDTWDEAELLRNEKEALGFYITGSPLDKYRKVLTAMGIPDITELEESADRSTVETAGIVTAIRRLRTKKDKERIMAALTLDDGEGSIEVMVWPDLYDAQHGGIKKDAAYLVKGTFEKSDRGSKILADSLRELEGILHSKGNGRKVIVNVQSGSADMRALRELLPSAQNGMPLYIRVRMADAEVLIQTSLEVMPDEPLIARVETALGAGALEIL